MTFKLGMFAAIDPGWKVAGFVCFFPALWLGVTCLLSFLGGWYELSLVYRDPSPPESWQFRGQSISVGGVGYRQCMNTTLEPAGVHLRPYIIFRLMHPPLCIPWAEIRFVAKREWLFYTSYKLVFAKSKVTMTFHRTLGEAILRGWQEAKGEAPAAPRRFGFAS